MAIPFKMQTLSLVSLLFHIVIILCNSSASCPCHIPCTDKNETCTCYGPCGDDGYGCKVNGAEYNFLNQIMCQQDQWIVQCVRQASCSPYNTVDDTNQYAAYKLETENIIYKDNTETLSWFGGNWFDFWGQNSDHLFTKDNANTHSTQRTLQTSPSKPIMNDLGRNKAGYNIIALPLYILMLDIISASILGMLICAGFIYSGTHYFAQSLSSGYNSYKPADGDSYNVYNRVRNALHSPTDENMSSTTSIDEYIDSEDDGDNKINNITEGNIEYDINKCVLV